MRDGLFLSGPPYESVTQVPRHRVVLLFWHSGMAWSELRMRIFYMGWVFFFFFSSSLSYGVDEIFRDLVWFKLRELWPENKLFQTHTCVQLWLFGSKLLSPYSGHPRGEKKKLNSVKHFDRNMSLECCELCLICRKNLEISSFCCKTSASYWNYLVPICFSLKVSIQCSYQDFSQYRNFRIYFQK